MWRSPSDSVQYEEWRAGTKLVNRELGSFGKRIQGGEESVGITRKVK